MSRRSASTLSHVIALWAVLGFLAILAQACVKLAPLAYQAVRSSGLAWYHWLFVSCWVVFMVYSEGYRGFQKQLAPRFAARAIYLGDNPVWWHVVLAPFYCIGLFHARTKRIVIQWCITVMIVGFVVIVRFFPQPWRGLVDLGVVLGLVWGAVSVVLSLVRALSNGKTADPELPAPGAVHAA